MQTDDHVPRQGGVRRSSEILSWPKCVLHGGDVRLERQVRARLDSAWHAFLRNLFFIL